jgi:hypothetical protein
MKFNRVSMRARFAAKKSDLERFFGLVLVSPLTLNVKI